MMSMQSVVYRNEFEAEYENNRLSSQLFDQAIANPQYRPSRCSHIGLVISTAFRESFSIIGRIISVVGHVIMLILAIALHSKRLNAFAFYTINLLILDPLRIISVVVKSAIRLSSAALGIIFPVVSTYGWKIAEKISEYNKSLEMNLYTRLGLNQVSPITGKMPRFPELAQAYFGGEKTFDIWLKTESLGNGQGIEAALRRDFLRYLERANEEMPEFFNTVLMADAFNNHYQSSKNSLIKEPLIISSYFSTFKGKDFRQFIDSISDESAEKASTNQGMIKLLIPYLISFFNKKSEEITLSQAEKMKAYEDYDLFLASLTPEQNKADEFRWALSKIAGQMEDNLAKLRGYGRFEYHR